MGLNALPPSLGYGRMAGFVYLVWPGIYRQIRLAVFAVIAFATSVVDVAMILGPGTPSTLAARLVGWMGDPDLSMRFLASAGAMLQLGVTVLAIVIWFAIERLGRMMREASANRGLRWRSDRVWRLLAVGVVTVCAAAMFTALVGLGIWSVAGLWQFPELLPSSLTLREWMRALPVAGSLLATTLIAGLASTCIAIVLTLLCLLREGDTRSNSVRAEALIYAPLIVPQVAFLFGLQFLFLTVGIVASLPALVLAHLVFVLPYVFLSLSDPWRSFDRRYEAIAAGLGKRRLAILFQIRLPLLIRPMLTAMAVGFAVSVGLYLPTLLIGAGRLSTVTTEAVALASGGARRTVGVFAFLQMLLPAASFAIAVAVPALLFRQRRDLKI